MNNTSNDYLTQQLIMKKTKQNFSRSQNKSFTWHLLLEMIIHLRNISKVTSHDPQKILYLASFIRNDNTFKEYFIV